MKLSPLAVMVVTTVLVATASVVSTAARANDLQTTQDAVVGTASTICPDSTTAFKLAVTDTLDITFNAVARTLHGAAMTMPATRYSVKPLSAGAYSAQQPGRFIATKATWPVVLQARAGGMLALYCVHVYPKGTTLP